jgi:SAM-dependent methyltransferase
MITETKQTTETTTTPEPQALKDAVRKFWGTLPCGVSHSSQPTDSHAFFEETEKHRFKVHTNFDQPFLKEAINFKEHTGKTVLEVGVGIGVDAMQWSRAGNRVFGIDYNLPSVQITKARFQDAGAQGRFLNSDAENLPFASNSFDLVYSFGVLHHTPGTEKAIRECYRVLKPGGQAIIMLYYKWSAMTLGTIILNQQVYRMGQPNGREYLPSHQGIFQARGQENVSAVPGCGNGYPIPLARAFWTLPQAHAAVAHVGKEPFAQPVWVEPHHPGEKVSLPCAV